MAGGVEILEENPLLQAGPFLRFDAVEPKHVCPGIRALLQQLENDLAELERTVQPTWSGLVEPLEKIVDRLSVVWRVVNHLKSVKDSEDLRSAIEEVQELEKLSLKFTENVLDATKCFEKLITDKKDIQGLPATALGLAAQTAASKGYEGATAENGPWIITLDFPSYRPVQQHARNRSLREELYRAYVTRASTGKLDNAPVIDQILRLRLERAKLLGYNNYAEVSMAMKMATVEKAEELLEKIRSASWDSAVQELEDLKTFAKKQNAEEANDMCHWDIMFWSEWLREAKYNINEEEMRPFFSLPKVMESLFTLAKMLFEIDVEPADGLAPVWDKDVKFYAVKDVSGCPVAYFYFDPYSRPSEKQGGAWMDQVFGRSRVLLQDGTSVRLPIAHIVCNQTPPVGDKPSLMTFCEVETVFHEFGHALQHMLTKQDEGLVAGNRGVEWDAVELPSQFMENWCYHRQTLMGMAKHYETGEILSEERYLKLLAARTFRKGSENLRQIRFASIDLELYSKYVPGGSETIFDVDQRIARRTQVVPLLQEDRFLCSFLHIFADAYAAGYYSYQAVKETGKRFRDTVLALGGGRPPLQVFIDFRGREPSIDPLLRHNGLLPTAAAA